MGEKIIPKKSEFVEVRTSGIHSKGLFAKKNIPKNTKILQYGGELINKKESEKRILNTYDEAEEDPERGENYVFDLNDKYDIDGDFDWNLAKYANHSCDENAEFTEIDGEIWIVSSRDIKKGEEITIDYGYGIEGHEDFPCKCGSKNCVGY
ncbi:MAG: SET domain-containing protein, partial [Nanoarchaeota archaeon]